MSAGKILRRSTRNERDGYIMRQERIAGNWSAKIPMYKFNCEGQIDFNNRWIREFASSETTMAKRG